MKYEYGCYLVSSEDCLWNDYESKLSSPDEISYVM